MLYVFYGSDENKSRVAYDKLVASLTDKHPEALLVRLDEFSFAEEEFDNLVYGQGLFSRRLIVTGNALCADKERAQFVERNLEVLKSSPNIFILIERAIPAALAKSFGKYAEKLVESNTFDRKNEEFNVFALLDALASRDRKRSWVLYQEALMAGLVPEDIFWRISWQIKALTLASLTSSAEEAEMKEFPYGKAKRASNNFKREELEHLSEKVVSLYHGSRRGRDLGVGLEQLVLNI